MVKKQTKQVKNTKPKKEKKGKKKHDNYFSKLMKELRLVKWPSFKEVAKYTISTVIFCIFIVAFFLLLNLLMSLIKGMFV